MARVTEVSKQANCPRCGRIHPAEVLEGLCRECLIEVSVNPAGSKRKGNSINPSKGPKAKGQGSGG